MCDESTTKDIGMVDRGVYATSGTSYPPSNFNE